MKKLLTLILSLLSGTTLMAQGWPSNYGGVMLQGFYWDSYDDTRWTNLEAQADELASTFDLIWIPQSGRSTWNPSMGYDPLYWFADYNSSFGNKEELLQMIKTFSQRGLKTIADVVINHRGNLSTWNDFPAEEYNGETYQLTYLDICSDDEAAAAGYDVGPNKDTGEGWDGMRDLDHKSENVQKNVKAYLKMLLDDFGYAGFRYDMVKGYAGEYTKLYNTDAKPQFSVGECWDGTQTIRNWIDATGKTSAAFDFQFRYTVRNAANNGTWNRLGQQNDGNWPLTSSSYESGAYRRYAVTFVENHDTEKRANAEQDPLRKDTLAANAYLLAMPGTPCVFLKHWMAYKREIRSMVEARKLAGITSESDYMGFRSSASYYANIVKSGDENRLLVVVGDADALASSINGSQWTRILAGHHYAYYLANTMNTPWADLASGSYEGEQTVTLTAVSTDTGARLVYTTDGTEPTAQSTAVESGTTLAVKAGTTVLKVGLLVGGTVSSVITREYSVSSFEPYDITVYVNTDKVGWTAVNFWTWGGDGTHAPTNSNWPGDQVSEPVAAGGRQWYAKSYRINSPTDYVNFVFSTNSGSPQTVDVEQVSRDTWFEVSDQTDGSKHRVDDVTATMGIGSPTTGDASTPARIYTLDGRYVGTQPEGLPKGVYIMNHRKLVVR